jgi:hypothetical protein
MMARATPLRAATLPARMNNGAARMMNESDNSATNREGMTMGLSTG